MCNFLTPLCLLDLENKSYQIFWILKIKKRRNWTKVKVMKEETKTKKLTNALQQVGALLEKDSIVWPYQKMNTIEFMRKYFPDADSAKEIEKFKKLTPEKFLQVIENKLRTIDAILGPLEDRMKALEFQHRLLSFFAIFSPRKLKECQKILNRTPRGIREGFTSEKVLELASKKGFSQKQVAEIMALWLNMRYYGALSCGLSPKFLLNSVKDANALRNKLETIERTLQNLEPKVESKREEYSNWVLKKQYIDEERKLMTFGPESIQTLETVLNTVYQESTRGELTQAEAMELVNKADKIIKTAIELGKSEKKTFISKEKLEKLNHIIKELKEKPKLFFIIAQISNLLEKKKPLKQEHISTLQKIVSVVELLPETTEEAVNNQDLKKNLQLIFEPLKYTPIEKKQIKKKSKKIRKSRRGSKKRQTEKEKEGIVELQNEIDILKKIFDETSKWFLERVIEEKKEGLENLIEIFNGIPIGLGTYVAHLVMNRSIKINIDKFKECLIGYLGKTGVYELYSQLGKGFKEEIEIEVADEIAIPPKADQRLAPIQKQIKFEFMKYMETAKLKKVPLFNILESYQIPPIHLVDLLLETSQNTLVNIINLNADQKLHTLMNLNPDEYEVKLKTLNLKLSSLMKNISKALEKVILTELDKKEFKKENIFENFSKEIKEIWIKNLINVKKIEPKVTEITTNKVSALAAKLEGGFKKKVPSEMRPGPLRAGPPSAVQKSEPPDIKQPIPSRAAPPTAAGRATPPSAAGRAAPPSAAGRAAPPSAAGRAAPPSAIDHSISTPPSNIPQSEPRQTVLSSNSTVDKKDKEIEIGSSGTKQGLIIKKVSKKGRKKKQRRVTKTISKKSKVEIEKTRTEVSQEIIEKDELEAPQIIDIESLEELEEIKDEKILQEKSESIVSEKMKTDSIKIMPDFAMPNTKPTINLMERTMHLKETIEEAMKLVESSMVDMDKLSPDSLKNALQLVYQLRELEKMDIGAIDPTKIRQIADLAESLKNSKETIIIQKEKLKQLETKLNERALLALDSKLELITKIFDDFIRDLKNTIAQLSGKGEQLIRHFGKKGGKEYRTRQRIKKEGKTLARHVDILKKIGNLPPKEFEHAKQVYLAFWRAREERKTKLIKKYSEILTDLIGIDRKEFLKLTRDPKLKTSLDDLFKVN